MFARKPAHDTAAAKIATDELKAAEAERKSALGRLLAALGKSLDEIPLESGVEMVARDLGGRKHE